MGYNHFRLLSAGSGLPTVSERSVTLHLAQAICVSFLAFGIVLAMISETGECYLSTFLFEGMNEGSDDEWLANFEADNG